MGQTSIATVIHACTWRGECAYAVDVGWCVMWQPSITSVSPKPCIQLIDDDGDDDDDDGEDNDDDDDQLVIYTPT
jgi:hypothetical protein